MRLSGVVRVGLAAYVVAYALPVVGEERGWEVAWIVFQALGDWEPVKDGLLAVWCNAANGGVLAGLLLWRGERVVGARAALGLAVGSALYWLWEMNSQEGFGPGYWIWLGGIALMFLGLMRARTE